MNDSESGWWSSVEAALAVGQRIAATSEQFNQACEHIVRLLKDASVLLQDGSHATASFLAISALEETAKIHLGIYRKSADPVPHRKDPLFRHEEKHRISAAPTVAMASRLQDAIGEARMKELIELARSGGLVQIREASLYLEQKQSALHVPIRAIAPSTARELLLFAIEAFDDELVGYTNHSLSLSTATDALFAKWAQPN
ncbi:MAG TPA: AbiV family abortive infection protein [Gammaproteobacteria bacterium]|nr:AbiV family abortive infection protein [Gammaproteobacteria bacterium]